METKRVLTPRLKTQKSFLGGDFLQSCTESTCTRRTVVS